MQVILDMHDSNYGKYHHVYFVNIVSSKKPTKMFLKNKYIAVEQPKLKKQTIEFNKPKPQSEM
jgi:hypothetical protein